MGDLTYDPDDEVEEIKMDKIRSRQRPMFARGANDAALKTAIDHAKSTGATVKRDRSAGTVEVTITIDDTTHTMFRAMRKCANVWIVMYSRQFYMEESA